MAFESKRIIIIDATNPLYKMAIDSSGRAQVDVAAWSVAASTELGRVRLSDTVNQVTLCGLSDAGFHPLPVYRDWPGQQAKEYKTGTVAISPATLTLDSAAMTANQCRLEMIKVSVDRGPVHVTLKRQTGVGSYTDDFEFWLGAAVGSNLGYAGNWEWECDFSNLLKVISGRVFRAVFDDNANNNTASVSVLWVWREQMA